MGLGQAAVPCCTSCGYSGYRHPANIIASHGPPLSTCPSSQAEVGHNFGAIHAFDYCGKDGWGDNTPVDYCKQSDNGCSQPNGYGIVPKCSSAPTAFGGGGGTIMSYCDEIAPNYIRNVAMTFGKNHPCEYCSTRSSARLRDRQPMCF